MDVLPPVGLILV